MIFDYSGSSVSDDGYAFQSPLVPEHSAWFGSVLFGGSRQPGAIDLPKHFRRSAHKFAQAVSVDLAKVAGVLAEWSLFERGPLPIEFGWLLPHRLCAHLRWLLFSNQIFRIAGAFSQRRSGLRVALQRSATLLPAQVFRGR